MRRRAGARQPVRAVTATAAQGRRLTLATMRLASSRTGEENAMCLYPSLRRMLAAAARAFAGFLLAWLLVLPFAYLLGPF